MKGSQKSFQDHRTGKKAQCPHFVFLNASLHDEGVRLKHERKFANQKKVLHNRNIGQSLNVSVNQSNGTAIKTQATRK